MSQNIAAILAHTEMFDNLTATQLELVAAICEPLQPDIKTILIKENDSTDDMYIIARGGVEIVMDPHFVSYQEPTNPNTSEPVVLTELLQGQVLGEVALVDQGIRSATARVSQKNTLVYRIQRERLMFLCDTYPELGYKIMKNIAADLAFKMRNTDLTLRQYQLLINQSKRDAT